MITMGMGPIKKMTNSVRTSMDALIVEQSEEVMSGL